REREREREREQNCSDCLNPLNNHKSYCPLKCNKCNDLAKLDTSTNKIDNSRCHNKDCENYFLKKNKSPSNSNSLSKFIKGFCKQCQRNDYIFAEGLCFKCYLTEMRLGIQERIREKGLKTVQIE